MRIRIHGRGVAAIWVLTCGVALMAACTSRAGSESARNTGEGEQQTMQFPIQKSEEEWRAQLTPAQYRVVREKGTERPFSGEYFRFEGTGSYDCVACGAKLFSSETKFACSSGWPSFYAPEGEEAIAEARDTSHGMVRTEVMCSQCGAHLGHVFKDGPRPTGLRYCINSVALKFVPGTARTNTNEAAEE